MCSINACNSYLHHFTLIYCTPFCLALLSSGPIHSIESSLATQTQAVAINLELSAHSSLVPLVEWQLGRLRTNWAIYTNLIEVPCQLAAARITLRLPIGVD